MNIIGIDPSITATGFCEADGHTWTQPGGVHGDARLAWINGAVSSMVNDSGFGSVNAVHLAMIEDLPTHAHGAGITGMVQGVVRLALLRCNVPYVLVTPATLKKFATGKGNATKADMRMALFQRAALDIRDDNQADAWWLRQMGLAHYDLGMDLPKANLAALAKVNWSDAPTPEAEK